MTTPRSYRFDLIDMHADRAHEEIKSLTQRTHDVIGVKVGFWIRSDAQKRRYEKAAKKEVLQK